MKSSFLEQSLITAEQHLAYKLETGAMPAQGAPKTLAITYQSSFFNRLKEELGLVSDERWGAGKLYRFEDKPDFAFAEFGVGAPIVSARLELMIAWGVERVLSFGTAGSYSPEVKIGDLVLCTGAWRDEGVSGHYLPPAEMAFPNQELTEQLASALPKHHRGYARTLDVFFRQTERQVAEYSAKGTLCAEMEAASLFAIGEAYGIPIASAFVISDCLATGQWRPQFGGEAVWDGWRQLASAALIP